MGHRLQAGPLLVAKILCFCHSAEGSCLMVNVPCRLDGGSYARWSWATPFMSDYSDSILTISMTKGGSPSASSIRKSVAQLVMGVRWAMLAECRRLLYRVFLDLLFRVPQPTLLGLRSCVA